MYVPSFCVCVCCVCTFRLFTDSPQNSSYSFICWYCLHICMGLKKKLTLRLCVQFQCCGALSALPGLGSLLAHVINAVFFFPLHLPVCYDKTITTYLVVRATITSSHYGNYGKQETFFFSILHERTLCLYLQSAYHMYAFLSLIAVSYVVSQVFFKKEEKKKQTTFWTISK